MPSNRSAVAAALLAVAVMAGSLTPAGALARAQFPVQSVGNRGLDVVALQHLLRHHGRSVAASGSFDGQTRTALVGFQKAKGLKADGVARIATWQALVPRMAQGSTGEAVIALKTQLNGKRAAGLAINGTFDASTKRALQAFQKRVGVGQSGVADEATWRHLVWYYMRPRLEGPLCGYELVSGRSAKWGTSAAVAQLAAAARLYEQRTRMKLAVGDLSNELGGALSGHRTHRVGLDVDIRTARKDGRSICRAGISYTMRSYDRAATRKLIQAIREAAPGHVKLIYFNDPVLIKEGLVTRHPNHDAHLHVRYCEADHPQSAYRCASAAGSASARDSSAPSDADGLSDAVAGKAAAAIRNDQAEAMLEPAARAGMPVELVSMLECGSAAWAA